MIFLQRIPKRTAIVLASLVFLQAIWPVSGWALTGGPSQPEVEGFSPVGVSEMVDLFTGNFQYNIPLLDIEGYPISLSYHSDPKTDEEASWVGLGWSLSPGILNREVRGFPDDFKGDNVKREYNIKKDETVGFSSEKAIEIFGKNLKFGLSKTSGIFYNTYRGWGREAGISPTFGLGAKNGPSYDLGVNFQYNSQSGFDIGLSGGLSTQGAQNFSVNTGLNSRTGLKDLSFGMSGKSKSANIGVQMGASFTFGQRTYFPASEMPFNNKSLNVAVRLGSELTGAHAGAELKGYYTGQALAFKKRTNKAYGYLHQTAGKQDISGILDFNREKEKPYTKNQPVLPLSFGTYDLFFAAGQGVSGQFKATRNDVGALSKAPFSNNSASLSYGVEAGVGNAVRVGGNVNVVKSQSLVTEWKDLNRASSNLAFSSSDGLYESVFFDNEGDLMTTDSNYYNAVGKKSPVRVALTPAGKDAIAINTFLPETNMKPEAAIAISSPLKRANREKRNQVFTYLNAEEASKAALEQTLSSHKPNTITYGCPGQNITYINRSNDTTYQKHHISEVTVTNPDGARYVYGIPAYNLEQVEATFSVNRVSAGTNPVDSLNFGLAPYSAGIENSINNNQGKENFFDKQTIPSYAYAYLLTGILSADYADRTGDGITEDDLGNAYKINYSRVSSNYKWRVPYQANKARHQQGRKSEPSASSDDKGHYLYGRKELWYVHSIESRNMLAQFYLSPRQDGLGVTGENGGIPIPTDTTARMWKLDSIRLFVKSELRKKGAASAIPIKTVHFRYYATAGEACPNIPNRLSSGGKLTLEKIYFTYGNSAKGVLNAYKFNYALKQTPYSTWKYDRWGNYQSNPASSHPNNLEFPFTIQNASQIQAGVWSLNEISLPSGSKISVEYEPDDYAYVQNRRAASMFFIKGYGRSNGSGGVIDVDKYLYVNGSGGSRTIMDYVVVSTAGYSISGLSASQIEKAFLEGMSKYLFFQASVPLKTDNNNRENITGYFERDPSKPLVSLDGGQSLALPIKLARDAKKSGSKPIHPITQAAFQVMRLEMPEVAYTAKGTFPGPSDDKAKNIFNALTKTFTASLNSEMKLFLNGYEQEGMKRGWARETALNSGVQRSWVRLCEPDYIKYGGGSRVKKITISDEWTQGGGPSTYGQEYTYQTTANDGQVISSGVASYEPLNGGEENPMRVPVAIQRDYNNSDGIYANRTPLAPTNYYYAENPVGESLFPSAQVGYREVKVKNLTYAGVSRTATGYSVYKFYTAKEFPVLTDFTRHQPLRSTSSPLNKFLKFDVFDYVTDTQGFVVEINDMHGKPRSEEVYNESGALIRSVRYDYKVDDPTLETMHLNNLASVLKPDGTKGTQLMGVDIDVWQEFNEQSNSTIGAGVAINVDAFFAWIFPVVVPVPLPMFQSEKTRLRTSVTTKLIKRSGILDKVTVTEDGSEAVTKNLIFDSETGQVLLTETLNEFKDKVYQFSYPAHWAYPAMGQSYANEGAFVQNVTINQGRFVGLANPGSIFKVGDEVLIQKQENGTLVTQPGRYFIAAIGVDPIMVMDRNGVVAFFTTGTFTVKVIRSGLRNQPSASIGAVALLTHPVNGAALTMDDTSKVLSATSAMYGQDWKMFCPGAISGNKYSSSTSYINPYVNGRLGNWRPTKSYVYYKELDQNTGSAARPRTQGTLKTFSPFWYRAGGIWASNQAMPWTLANNLTAYDIRGNVVETKNPIGIYSSSQYGYKFSRVIAIADNAAYREMAYEGFEEYAFNQGCGPDQGMARKLYFERLGNSDSTAAHTGRFSAKVWPLDSIYVSIEKVQTSDCVSGGSSLREEPAASQLRSASPAAPSDPIVPFNCTDCLPNMGILKDTTAEGSPGIYQYNISVWVATQSSLNSGATPQSALVSIWAYSGSTPFQIPFTPASGNVVVDGWMRIEGKIDLSSITNISKIDVRLKNTSSTEYAYFDDFRIHPWKANMKSFVYDPWSLRLMAELDENNYATYYEYDDEGRLIRIKKETEKGVMTVKEARTQLKKNNDPQ